MPKIKLTDLTVKTIPIPEKGQVDYWDELLGSFALRVSDRGTKSWIVQPHIIHLGKWKSVRITLGRYPDVSLSQARERAKETFQLAEGGRDPRPHLRSDTEQRKVESRNTFAVRADEFLANYVVREKLEPSTVRQYLHTLKGASTASWRDRPITEILRRDIYDFLDAIMAKGRPAAANRALTDLRKFFNWCVEREIISVAPTDKVRPPAKNVRRDRALSEAEIVEVWSAFEASAEPFGPMFKILLLTGQRRDEVAGMRWDELKNLDGREPIWELPESRTKNDRPHLVPLVPQVVAILKGIVPHDSSPFVFTTKGITCVSGFSKAKVRVDGFVAKARMEGNIPAPMPHWTAHDLRRTFSTRLHEDLGILPHVVESILNHVSGYMANVAGTYNRALYLPARREALGKWADHVEKLVKESRSKQATFPDLNLIDLAQGAQTMAAC